MSMKRYTGTKTLAATPMTRGEYNAYRGWTAPEGEPQDVAGYLVEYEDGGKANDSRHAGYISWSPADVFERTYRETSAEVFIQPKITGYRQLSEQEVALMNEGKALAEQCGAYIAKLRAHPPAGAPARPVEGGELQPLDQRWVAIGATDLQRGFMAVIRGIAQPTTF